MTAPVGIGLWCLFGLLVLAGGEVFLRACGTQPVLPWAQNFCPAPAHGDMRREAETGEALRRQVHAAEIRLAEMQPCPPPQQSAESRSMDRRVEQRRGKRGKLQFTLSWDTLDDLDIDVYCPGGRLSSFAGQRGPGICGDGIKDIDANGDLVRNVSSTPVENVTWAADVPDGTYVVAVVEYKARRQGGNTVPFSLRIRWDGKEQICHDVVTEWPQSEFLHEDGKIYRGTYRTITWQSSEPLPGCEFAVQRTIEVPPK